MNNLRFLGQILLWTGFLSASLAAVSRKEFDYLPQNERDALLSLPDGGSLMQSEVESLAEVPIRELDSDAFVTLVERMKPLIEEQLAFQDRVDAVSGMPLQQLDQDELTQLQELLPSLLEQAQQRAERPENSPEPLSEEEQAAVRAETQPVSRNELTKQRIFILENRWPTVPWLWYGLSIAIGIVGVLCLRATSKSADQDTVRVEAEYTVVQNSLAQLETAMHELGSQMQELQPAEVVDRIDTQFAEPFSEFADARNALIQRFGLHVFADVMSAFSSAERFTNRAWSAAADGYMNEVRTCIETAQHHLDQTRLLLNQAEEALDR